MRSFSALIYAKVKEPGCDIRKSHRGNTDKITLMISNRSVDRVSWESKQCPWEVLFSYRFRIFTFSSQSESCYHLQPLESILKEILHLMVDVALRKGIRPGVQEDIENHRHLYSYRFQVFSFIYVRTCFKHDCQIKPRSN